MTQAQLASAARIPRPNLSHIEGGDRDVTLGALRALALALDVTPGTLADGIPPFEGTSPSGRAAMERIAAAAQGVRAPETVASLGPGHYCFVATRAVTPPMPPVEFKRVIVVPFTQYDEVAGRRTGQVRGQR